MKPPPRRRGVPERFSGSGVKPGAAPSVWTSWSRLEKKHLLGALKLQERRGEEELNTEEIQSTLPDRSNEQIAAFLSFLKSQVRSRVFRTVSRKRLEEKRRAVPVQVWTGLSKEMSGTLGDSLSSAFSQMLMVASTEPCSLLHSLPPRPTSVPDRTLLVPTGPANQNPGQPGSSNQSAAVTQTGADDSVDFEKVYKFLMASVKEGGGEPKLSAMESAVILDLILSLPEELPLLDGKELQHQLRQVYSRVTAAAQPPARANQRPAPAHRANQRPAPAHRANQRPAPAPRANQRPAPAPRANQRPAPAPRAKPNEEAGTSTNQEADAAPDQDDISTAATNESGGAKTAANESEGAKTAANESEGAKTAANQSEVTKTAANESEGAKTAANESEGAKTAANESGGAHTGTNESQDTNTAASGSVDSAVGKPTNQESRQRESDWSRAGLCPLNPFMVPLKLLVRAEKSDVIVTSLMSR